MACDPSAPVWGIRYQQTSGKIEQVVVKHIRNADGGCQGVGIRVESTGPTANVTVADTLVHDFTRVGINGNGKGVNLTVKDNLVVGPALPKVWAPNGIQIARGAKGTVSKNEVHDATSPNPPAGAGSGILLFCAGLATVSDNEVFASDLGIAVSDNAKAKVLRNTVRDSVFDAYSLQFIGTLFGPLGCPTFPSRTEKNVLQNNKALDSGENGISLAGFDPDLPVFPQDNTITHNQIRDSGLNGIAVFNGEANRFTNNTISRSDLAGSGGFDAYDATDPTPNSWTNNTCNTAGKEQNQPGLCE
jgi:parallel beta-helix repeat protein